MHDTARMTGQAFFAAYGKSGDLILDVGSYDVNGTLKPFIPSGATYTGCDMTEGPNVDVVLDDPHRLPFEDESFQIITSTSCLEHDEFFWLTFLEMARVVRSGGFVYLSAPTGGGVHRHPIDSWRFYPDAGLSLAKWARRNGHDLKLVESFILPPGGEGWSDFVAVFCKSPDDSISPRLAFPQTQHRNSEI